MASKHSSNYQLNLWEPGDDFLREEFNENSEKIDTALGAHNTALGERLRLVSNSYTGNGAQTRTIELGVAAKLVFIVPDSGTPGDCPAVIVRGQSAGNVNQYIGNSYYSFTCAWSGTALTLTSAVNVTLNVQSVRYRWIALY